MKENNNSWVEKYRPSSLNDLVVTKNIRALGKKIIDSRKSQNLLLYGSYGVGKTSFAKILMKELNYEMRSPESRKIDSIRHLYKISSITTVLGCKFAAFIDEADQLQQDVQKEMLRFLEGENTTIQFSILIANDISKIHNGVRSRCKELCFDWSDEEIKTEIKENVRMRIAWILKNESVKYGISDLNTYVDRMIDRKPLDIRKLINEIEGEVSNDNRLMIA